MLVGPYLEFNRKVWLLPLSMRLEPRPGTWTRLTLVDKKGLRLRTEIEVQWATTPGELTVYTSHRKSATFKYEDLGEYMPMISDREIKSALAQQPKAKALADSVLKFGKREALKFVGDVLTEVNAHTLARAFDEGSSIGAMSVEDVSRQLGYGIEATTAFAFFVATKAGAVSAAEAAAESIARTIRQSIFEDRRGD